MPSQISTNVLRKIPVVLVAFFAPLSAQGPSRLSPDPPNHLRGTVVNSVTHEPVPHALVLSPDDHFATKTDDQGRFEFTFPQPATLPLSPSSGVVITRFPAAPANRPYALTARKPGFLQITDGSELITIAPDQADVTIPLTPEGRILGHVTLTNDDSADKVQVVLYRRDNQSGRERWNTATNELRTRSNGEFRFANLEPGTYKLFTLEYMDRDPLTFDPRGQLFGYPPVYYPAASDFQSATAIHLNAGETFQATLAPSRREYYAVKLTLSNAPPGLESQVDVWPQDHPGPGYSLGYNFRNSSIEGALPNGSYTVLLHTYGPAALTGLTGITVGGAPALGSVVLVPGTIVPVTVKEELQHKPEGVAASFNNDATGATFTINPQRPNYLNLLLVPLSQFGTAQDVGLRQPTGPDDTSLLFENVSPGRYHVQAQTSIGYVSSMASGNTNLLLEPLVIAPGTSPESIEVTVRDDGGEIYGTLGVAAQDATLSFATQSFAPRPTFSTPHMRRVGSAQHGSPAIYFLPASSNSGQFTATYANSAGEFAVYQLPPGSYRILAFNRPHPELEFSSEDELRRYDARAQRIDVNPGEKKSLQLEFDSDND